jgi:hypothetical protein
MATGYQHGGKLDDDADRDMTTAPLPDRPCQRCFKGRWVLPHSICRDCIDQSRAHKPAKAGS